MRQETIVRELYQFDELSDKAKEAAREWYSQGLYLDSWAFDHVIDDAKAIAKLMGLDISNVYYNIGYVQGAGACFEGSYNFVKGSVKAVKGYAPLDKELHAIAESLAKLQRSNKFKLMARIKANDRYMALDIESYIESFGYDWPSDNDENELKEALESFSHWIFKQLRAADDDMNSNESIDENIRINEYEFLANGKRA